MVSFKFIRIAFVAVLVVFTVRHVGAAQGLAGTVTGVVKDSSGGVLPGVTVKVSSAAGGAGLEGTTDADGIYRVTAIPPGSYRIEAALDGFETASLVVEIGR